jgi:hypothetical protein
MIKIRKSNWFLSSLTLTITSIPLLLIGDWAFSINNVNQEIGLTLGVFIVTIFSYFFTPYISYDEEKFIIHKNKDENYFFDQISSIKVSKLFQYIEINYDDKTIIINFFFYKKSDVSLFLVKLENEELNDTNK